MGTCPSPPRVPWDSCCFTSRSPSQPQPLPGRHPCAQPRGEPSSSPCPPLPLRPRPQPGVLVSAPLLAAQPLPQALGVPAQGPGPWVNNHVPGARLQTGHWEPRHKVAFVSRSTRRWTETSGLLPLVLKPLPSWGLAPPHPPVSPSPPPPPLRQCPRHPHPSTLPRSFACHQTPSINNRSGPTDHSPTMGPEPAAARASAEETHGPLAGSQTRSSREETPISH